MRLAVSLLDGLNVVLNVVLIDIVLCCMLSKNKQLVPYERRKVNLKLP